MTYGRPQWPRPRKGHTLTHISFRPDGSVRSATFTPNSRLKREAVDQAPASRRGVLQKDLFG